MEAAKKGGTCRFTGYLATTTTRQPRWWDVVVSPIENAEGKPERLLVVSRDVSEQKRNERVLGEAHLQVARSEERWRSVFENSAIGVALTDLSGRFLATNSVYQKMVGYSDEELRALSFIDITHADYREANWALAAELREGKRQHFQIEKQYRCKNGSLMWVSNNVSLVPGTESTPQFIMALSEDITERKRAEEALRKSEQMKRSLLDINNAIITNLTEEALLLPFPRQSALPFPSIDAPYSHLQRLRPGCLAAVAPLEYCAGNREGSSSSRQERSHRSHSDGGEHEPGNLRL